MCLFDGDYQGASKNLLPFKQLSELLHLYNSHKSGVAKFIQDLIRKKENELIRNIEAELKRVPITINEGKGHAKGCDVRVQSIVDSWVVSFKKQSAVVSLDLNCEVAGTAFFL